MNIFKNSKLVLAAIVLSLSATCAYSYPPDNAAVLYYKAASLYEVDDEMAEMLSDLQKGKIELNDRIREFVKKNRLIINTVLDATEVKNCDWGMDFSQGLDMMFPRLGSFRRLVYLVIADAKILAAEGDYEVALGRCMNLYKMARHLNDRVYINYLVGIAVNGITNNCVNRIMSDMPQGMQSLTGLKNQLIEIDSIPLSFKPALLGERETMLMLMTLEYIPDIVRFCERELDEPTKEKLLSADEAFLERNRAYYENYVTDIIAAFDMPYVKGYAIMKDLAEKMLKDVKENPDATLTGILAPATDRIFSLSTRFETHNNAIKTAIELYMIKARTGKLPDALPTGLPGDLFSGKAFQYEKTAEGFILRCQGKDLGKDEIYEYEFKVKK
jgi:hypothetical protein